jgi:putative SOS response-associated peptidase YedK
MCNHYRNDIRKLGASREFYGFEEFSETKLQFDNLPSDVYPDRMGVVLRKGDREIEASSMRWGFPPPSGTRPVTNVRNLKSSWWRQWLKTEHRCLVPFTAFAEYTDALPKREVWFEMRTGAPACFAGIWRPWTGTRGTKANPESGQHLLFSFLTCDPNGVVAPVHAKAMPVILPDAVAQRTWLEAPVEEVESLARPLDDALLRVEG